MAIDVMFVAVNTVGGGAERMMFNIIGTLRTSLKTKLLVTSNDEIPDEVPAIAAVKFGKRHAYSAFFSILRDIFKERPRYLFTTSSSLGYVLILAKHLLPDYNPKVFIRCAVPPSEIYSHSLKSRLLNSVIRVTYNGADVVIAQTEFMRQDLIRTYRLKKERVRYIRNIVDVKLLTDKAAQPAETGYNPENFNIIAAGALYSVKGFDLLINAFASISEKCPTATLIIIGAERYEPGYRNMLQSMIDDFGLSTRIRLAGHQNNSYVYIKNADLLVMSSRKEGYPNVVLEALSLGTPVVATDVVDWSGVIDNGRNGYVVPKENVQSLADAIKKAIASPLDPKAVKFSNFDYNTIFK